MLAAVGPSDLIGEDEVPISSPAIHVSLARWTQSPETRCFFSAGMPAQPILLDPKYLAGKANKADRNLGWHSLCFRCCCSEMWSP